MSDVLRLSLPLTVWLAAFSGIYGLQGALCAAGLEGGQARAALLAAAALSLAAQGGLALALAAPRWASPRPFVQRTTTALAVVAVVAAAWTLLPVAVASACL